MNDTCHLASRLATLTPTAPAPRALLVAPALAASALALLAVLATGCSAGQGAGGDDSATSSRDTAVSGGGTAGATAGPSGATAAGGGGGGGAPATGGGTPAAGGAAGAATPGGRAYVESVDVMLLESFPLQVRVAIAGQLSDGCTRLAEPRVRRDGNTFRVELPTTREQGICTQALVPFEETVALDVQGLPKGTYTVDVAGTTGTFTFDRDNRLGP